MRRPSLNHTYRLVWSRRDSAYVAVAETASSRGKAGRLGRALALVIGAGAIALAHGAALPTNGVVTAGAGSIVQSGNVLTVNQTTSRMAVDWQSFSIGQGNSVNFVQPSASSVALNRVVGADVSLIQGNLTANGQVFLINPNGVLFSPTAQVNVGGLVASTLNLSNADFMAGSYKFSGTSGNAIVNQGNITTANGGTIALIAAKITNDGDLTANAGNVLLGAGSKVTLDMGGPVKLQVENDKLETLIQNGGAIRAAGGHVLLTSQAANSLTSSVINNTGLIEAQTLATGEKGEVILFAHGGTMNVGGTIDAQGGFVETSGKTFSIAPGTTVKAGEWLIDPVNIDIDATLAATIDTALGTGSVTITTDGACTGVTCSGTGSDGNINVNSDLTWSSNRTLTLRADNNINVNANITHTGTSAGGVIFLYGQGSADGGTSTYTATGTVTSPSLQWRKGSDTASTRYAVVDGNYFLGGKYLELGFCGPSASNCSSGGEAGKFGTTNKPSLFFGRSTGSGIGMVGDADGFGTGADLRIDYFLPGSPAEQFTAGYTGIADTRNFATVANSGLFQFMPLGADNTISLKYSAVLGGNLKVEQLISVRPSDAFFNNTVTLTNVGGSSLANVRFARSFDPDNTVDKGGSYSTVQKIEQSLAAGDTANVVSATSQSGDAYYTAAGNKTAKIIYYSTDASTTVGYGSAFFGGTSISTMATAASALTKGSSQSGDIGIGIIFDGGTMAAGVSKSFSYLMSLDNRDISTILSGLGAAAGVTTTTPTPTTTVNPPVIAATTQAQANVKPDASVVQWPRILPSLPSPSTTPGYLGSSGGLTFVSMRSESPSGEAGRPSGSSAPSPSVLAQGGGVDPAGFMRVFVVDGGVRLPTAAQENLPDRGERR